MATTTEKGYCPERLFMRKETVCMCGGGGGRLDCFLENNGEKEELESAVYSRVKSFL